MSSFSMADILRVCTENINSRKSSGGVTYELFYSNNPSNPRYDGKMTGGTVKGLIEEFRAHGGAFRYAVIFKMGDYNKPLRYFDRAKSKKFFSMTRTGVKRKKNVG